MNKMKREPSSSLANEAQQIRFKTTLK